MGITKSELFTAQQNELAHVCRVLGHPARIAILEHLQCANACITSDLVTELGLAQATVSQHLNELKNVDLIQGTIEGSGRSYCINRTRWDELHTKISAFFNESPHNLGNTCCK
jgi:predicted transcriptional regulator